MERYIVTQLDSRQLVVIIDRDTLEIFIGLTDYNTGKAVRINLLQMESIQLMRFLQGG